MTSRWAIATTSLVTQTHVQRNHNSNYVFLANITLLELGEYICNISATLQMSNKLEAKVVYKAITILFQKNKLMT